MADRATVELAPTREPERRPGVADLRAGELMRRGHAKHGRAAPNWHSPISQERGSLAPARFPRSGVLFPLSERAQPHRSERLFDPMGLGTMGRLWPQKSSSSTAPGSTTSRTS